MTREDVLKEVSKIIYDCFPDLADVALTETTDFASETDIDSMGFILVMCKIEAAYNISIPEKEWASYTVLGDVIDAIIKRI